MARTKRNPEDPTIIKKYANRRLYDTGRSSYVTLNDLCEMVQEGHDFVVVDAKTGDDITRSVLTQIIADQESEEENLLPTNFLRNLITFYGDSMKGLVPNYLENTLDLFVKNQEQMREQFGKSFENVPGINGVNTMFTPNTEALQELSRKNMEMFERTMKMFSPFGMTYGENPSQKDD